MGIKNSFLVQQLLKSTLAKDLKLMAPKKKAGRPVAAKTAVTTQSADVREIEIFEDGALLDLPPVMKESKYPWRALGEVDPGAKAFFVACGSEEEAGTLRTSVYTSGLNYYRVRKMDLLPVVRVMKNKDVWGVGAKVELKTQSEEGD